MSYNRDKDIIQGAIYEFFPLTAGGIGGMADRLSGKIAEALYMRKHYLFRLSEMLIDEGYTLAVYCDGEPVTECPEGTANWCGDIIARKLTDPALVFEDTQAVDDATIQVYDKPNGYLGWIYVTNCNDEDESLCDYSCGESATYAKLLDNFK